MIQNGLLKPFGAYIWAIVWILLMSSSLAGCVKRTDFEQLSISEGGVEITLEWEVQATPTPLMFVFFSAADGTLYKEYEGTTEGFKGTLPAGEYKMIAYDKSAQQVGFRNMNTYEGAEAYALTQERTILSRADEKILIAEPGAMHSLGECVGLTTLSVVADQVLKAKATPKNRTRSVVLNFEINNGADITSILGDIDGVSSAVQLATGKYMDYSARLSFQVNCANDGTFQTAVSLFNFISAEEGSTYVHTMDITLGSDDGATHDMTLDLTDTIRDITNNNGGVIPIEIPIEIIVDMTDVNHITATVKPWDKGEGGGSVID